MSKRNKKMRSNRPAFKLEALEQRQLLATIVGGSGGTEVGSDISVGGKVYDQILMTGSSIQVQADAGQIVRVDWLDADGDIVRAEYSGKGTLQIDLAGANAGIAQAVTKYTGVTNKYVQGLASFTITGSDASSNFLTTSLGPVTAFNGLANPIFAAGTTVGGNSTANIARLVIVGDSTQLVGGAGTAFGSIFAGNAVFSDTSGIVGIYAPSTAIKTGNSVTIGDIVPVGTTATPILQLGLFSDVKTVTIAGGKLASASSGVAYSYANVSTIVSTTGTNSLGGKVVTQTIAQPGTAAVTYSSGLGTITVDGTTATTAFLDSQYKASYLTDVIITGGLPAGVTFHALQFGSVTVAGNLAGILTTDVNDDNVSNTCEQGIGNVTIQGDILDGGYIESAATIGNVTVTGKVTHTTTAPTVPIVNIPTPNAIAVIGTLGKASASAAIGNISFGGDVSIGSINGVNGATSTVTVAESLISANKNPNQSATVTGSLSTTVAIGTITGTNLVVNSGAATVSAISLLSNAAAGTLGTASGNIGAITFTGDVTLQSTGAGGIYSARGIGAITAKSLTINTATSNATPTAATPAPQGGIVALNTTASNGSIGNITTTGGNLTLTAGVIRATGAIGNISASNTGNIVINSTGIYSGSNIGNITVDSGDLTTAAAAIIQSGNGSTTVIGTTSNGNIGTITLKNGNLTVGGAVTANGGNIGDITLTNTAGGSNLNANVSATSANSLGGAIGNITVTSGNLTVGNTANSVVSAATSIGNITVTKGNLQVGTGAFTASGFKAINGTDWAGTSIGNVTVSAGTLTGKSTQIEFQANKIGNVSVTVPSTGGAQTALADVIFSAKGTTAATITTASIGNVTLDTSANTNAGTFIATSTAASTTAATGTGFSSSGNIGTITINANNAGKIIGSAATGLIFRAGNSEMGLNANTLAAGVALTANNASVSIGNVAISGNLSTGAQGVSPGGGTAGAAVAGTGLVISSGADTSGNTAGLFETNTGAGAVSAGTKLTSGTIGTVTINDSNGSVLRSNFNSGSVTETASSNNSGNSVIVADGIGVITVNTGINILNITPTGNPLAGVLGVTGIAATTQVFTAADTTKLFIVVL